MLMTALLANSLTLAEFPDQAAGGIDLNANANKME